MPAAQSCLTLCDAMDFSLPGSCVHGTLQARIVEKVAISYASGPYTDVIKKNTFLKRIKSLTVDSEIC